METKNEYNISLFQLNDLFLIAVTISFCGALLIIPTCFSLVPKVVALSDKAGHTTQSLPAIEQPQTSEPDASISQFALASQSPEEGKKGAGKNRSLYGVDALGIHLQTEKTAFGLNGNPPVSPSDQRIPYTKIINRIAGRYEVDPHLIRAIIFAESGYNPKATSKKGARGLMQLMPSTAESLGVLDSYDPEENIDGGVRYFKSLLDRFEGDVQLALAAYNAGSRHVRNYEGVPPFRATQLYIKKVLKFQQKFKTEMNAGSKKIA